MFKLLTLLFAGLFLTMLIGGRDGGQQRLGLQGHYAPPPPVETVRADSAPADLPEARPLAALPAAAAVLASLPPAPPPPALAPALPAVDAAPASPPAAAADAGPPAGEPLPLRWVAANAINVRGGPSTTDAVIGRLTRNEAVSVVAEAGDGWLLVRIEGDGIEGYVAARLLTDRAP